MNYKQKLEVYNKEVEKINNQVKKKLDEAKSEIEKLVEKQNKKEQEEIQKQNEAPCSVCKKSEFILKYRGETNTNAVLCCRNCQNERKIQIPKYVSCDDILEVNLPAIFPYIESFHQANNWIKNYGAEVAIELSRNYFIRDYCGLYKFTKEQIQKTGLEFKYNYPKKPINYFKQSLNISMYAIIIGICIYFFF